MGSLWSGILFYFEGLKLNVLCTSSVEILHYSDHVNNLEPLNICTILSTYQGLHLIKAWSDSGQWSPAGIQTLYTDFRL